MSLPPRTDNPFSGSRLRPGMLPFAFGERASLDECLARLERTAGWGQIRGPHGSGKSTLLAALVPRLEAAGWQIVAFTLHDGQRRLPAVRREMQSWGPSTQLVVDGCEQLSFVERWRWMRYCRRRGCGLLATAHDDLGLPDIYVTAPTPELARRLAAQLQAGWPPRVAAEDVDRCYAQHGGNLRETFFALYDLYEWRRRA